MKAAIVIDSFKLSIFERHLTQGGYTFVKSLGISPDTLILTVTTENTDALQVVVTAANTESANIGRLQ